MSSRDARTENWIKRPAVHCMLLVLMALWSWGTAEALKLPAIFGDHMVIQAGRATPVWGWANPSERIRIEVNGRVWARATADQQGRWRADVAACPKAGSRLEIRVRGSKEEIMLRDVLAGEVWIGSGQSNMEWPVKLTMNA
ncbi:MAG TPA: hypothetical protein PLO53_05095, partial [Candidatus Hydrogenedentes bacterium]|nr:hypothetical protein [Candidatus Hydrogenedentota bacterium]